MWMVTACGTNSAIFSLFGGYSMSTKVWNEKSYVPGCEDRPGLHVKKKKVVKKIGLLDNVVVIEE